MKRSLLLLAVLLVSFVATVPVAAADDPTGTISGTVTAAGAPVRNATVDFAVGGNVSAQTTTDTDGTYTSPDLPVGLYTVEFEAPDGQNLARQYWKDADDLSHAEQVPVDEGAVTDGIDAALRPGASISGRVTDRATGDGVPQTSVEVDDADGQTVTYASTHADGTYEVVGLSAGTYTLQFSPYDASIRHDHYPVDAADPAPLTLSAGQSRTGVDVALHELGRITGTVTDANGPVAGAAVKLYYPDGSPGPGLPTGTDGTYAFKGLDPGTYRVGFSPPTGSTDAPSFYSDVTTLAGAVPVTADLDHTASGIDGHLPSGASISGRVFDESQPGGICAFVDVYLLRLDGSQVAQTALGACGTNRPDGSYEFDNVPAGTYAVRYVPEHLGAGRYANADLPQYSGGSSTLAGATTITVAPGQAETGRDATLATGAQITGTIVKGTGIGWWSTPRGAVDCVPTVDVYDAGGADVRSLLSDVDFSQSAIAGLPRVTYTVQGLPSGTYTVRATCENSLREVIYRPTYYPAATAATATPVTVSAPGQTTDRDITMPLNAGIEGRVTDESGHPLGGIVVRAVDATGNDREGAFTESDADGRFAMYVQYGSWSLSAYDPSGTHRPSYLGGSSETTSAPVVLSYGTPLREGADFSLGSQPTAGAISGIVRDASGPLKGIQVTAYGPQGQLGASVATAADGTYTLAGLAPGSWRVGFVDPTGAHVSSFSDDESTLAAADPVEIAGVGATTSGIDALLSTVATGSSSGGPAAPAPPSYPAPVETPVGRPDGLAGLLTPLASPGATTITASPLAFQVPTSRLRFRHRKATVRTLCAGAVGCSGSLVLRSHGVTIARRSFAVREGRGKVVLTTRRRLSSSRATTAVLSLTVGKHVVQRADVDVSR